MPPSFPSMQYPLPDGVAMMSVAVPTRPTALPRTGASPRVMTEPSALTSHPPVPFGRMAESTTRDDSGRVVTVVGGQVVVVVGAGCVVTVPTGFGDVVPEL